MPLHGVEGRGLGRIVGGQRVAHDDAPAGPAHADHLGQGPGRLLQVMERVAAADDVEGAVRRRAAHRRRPGAIRRCRAPWRRRARRASTSMASVASSPVARRTRPANAHTTEPGPQATSRETSLGERSGGADQQVERGLAVVRRRSRKLRRLAGELVGDGGGMRGGCTAVVIGSVILEPPKAGARPFSGEGPEGRMRGPCRSPLTLFAKWLATASIRG